MKSKIIYVDFIKKRRVSCIHFHINKIRNYLFNKLNPNNTSNTTITKVDNVRNIVNKNYY